jgi:hypothetical protein
MTSLPAWSQDPDPATLIKLHATPWTIDGKPVLGTYAAGKDKLQDLRLLKDAGMNTILGDEVHLDPKSPEGAYCLENGIKVIYHLTSHIYHGVKLREPITPDQPTLPLHFAGGRPARESKVIQLDDELIRYEDMTDEGLTNCERGYGGTTPAAHREGVILFWPEPCAAEVEKVKDSPNLFGYYVLDDSPGDAVSVLRALYQTIRKVDPGQDHPVCAGFGDAGSAINLAPGVCDIMAIYWYPVGTKKYDRERTSQEVQFMLTKARERVPGIPFMGIYQAFDGRPAQTGQGVPTPEQLREQLEDFVREGACGLIAFISQGGGLLGWADLPELGAVVKSANEEILATGGLKVRPETEAMVHNRIQPQGHWDHPLPVHGVVPAWYVLGPFEDKEGKMLEADLPPDHGIDLNAVYPVKFGTAGWRIRETTNGVLGLSNIYGDQVGVQKCIDYAVCDVTSPIEQAVQMRLCTDDDAIVRLNGKEVYRFDGPRGLEYDKDIVPITLPQGQSRIEVKLNNRAGMWGLYMRFTGPEGKPLEGLTFAPTTTN